MKTLLIPKFDDRLNFTGYKKILIKNKIDTEEYNKIVSELPGITQGYCEEIYTITKTKKPIEIRSFYDIRQGKAVNKLKNFYITVI